MAATKLNYINPLDIPPKIIESVVNSFSKSLVQKGVLDHEVIESKIFVYFDMDYYANRITIGIKDIFGEWHSQTITVDTRDFPL